MVLTGYNTDIEHGGIVYHVQTEDKGLDNPVVESLVYCGGEIIESRCHSYADLTEAGECSEDEILMRMETQHQALIREIRAANRPLVGICFGHQIIAQGDGHAAVVLGGVGADLGLYYRPARHASFGVAVQNALSGRVAQSSAGNSGLSLGFTNTAKAPGF